MVVVKVKCWDVLQLMLGRVANNRLPEVVNTGNICRTVVCFLVRKIAVHFEYQKGVYFRIGHISIGWVLSFLGRGQMAQVSSKNR
jgi:hypothetical protein